MRVGFFVALVAVGLLSPLPAMAQSPMPGWEEYVTVGTNQWSPNKSHTAFMSDQPYSLDSGHAFGSPLNSGVLSSAVPAGGRPFLIDFSWFKPWSENYRKWFAWTWWPGSNYVLMASGLGVGLLFVRHWLQKWT